MSDIETGEVPPVSMASPADHYYAESIPSEPTMCQEVTVETSVYQADTDYTEEVEIPQSCKQSSHHRGPIPAEWIGDKRSRQKCFSKRVKTFQTQAKALHQMCGATVMATVVAESGRKLTIAYPPLTTRTVKVQVGESGLAPPRLPRSPPASHSPKKQKRTVTINNMPGKSTKTKKLPPLGTRTQNKCAICSLIYNSKADFQFKKKHALQQTWLGCDFDECQYWAHAVCAGRKILSRKTLANLKFFCPAHQ